MHPAAERRAVWLYCLAGMAHEGERLWRAGEGVHACACVPWWVATALVAGNCCVLLDTTMRWCVRDVPGMLSGMRSVSESRGSIIRGGGWCGIRRGGSAERREPRFAWLGRAWPRLSPRAERRLQGCAMLCSMGLSNSGAQQLCYASSRGSEQGQLA